MKTCRTASFAVLLILTIFVSACKNGESYKVIYYDPPAEHNAIRETAGNKLDQKYRIALVPKIDGIAYFDVAKQGALEAGKALDIEVIYTGPRIADAEHQIEVVEQLIEQNVDAIAIAANDPAALSDVMRKAQQHGIRVLTWDSDTIPEARTFFVNQVDAETLGRHIMNSLALHQKERGSFAIMTGSLTAMNLNEWIKWIKVQQQEYYPHMQFVDLVANDEDPERAYELALDLLERYPDLGGIIGVATISSPAAAKAIMDTGRANETIVVGVSSPALMKPYIEAGIAPVTTLWSPQKLGYLTVYLAKQLLDGQMPFDGQEIPNVGNIRVRGDVVIMGEPLDFTKENVNEYDF
jgi:ABC-type sugar transport system, periplasmic component